MKKEYRNFKDAKTFVHSLNLKSQKEWSMYCKSGNKPDNIPADPRTHYKNKGWKNSGDWLGTGTIASYNIKFKSFASARKFAHSLNLKSYDQWIGYTKSGNKPDDIPAYPMRTYRKKGWNGMSDWLANGRSNKLKSFTEAKKFVQKLKFTNRDDWVKYCKSGKKPIDIPKSPSAVYKKEWQGWGDWLDSGFIATQKRKYDSFTDAKKFVQKLKLKNSKEWNVFCKSGNKPDNITASPQKTYKNNGWLSWGDWLGTGFVYQGKRKYRSFKESREYVRKLGLKNYNDWYALIKSGKLPKDIPSSPSFVYSKKRKK